MHSARVSFFLPRFFTVCRHVSLSIYFSIKVKSITPSTNISTLALDILEKCKLIHPSKTPEIEQLLYYLQNRSQNIPKADPNSSNGSNQNNNKKELPEPELENLSDYIELLYEDLENKIDASGQILILARNPENLESLLSSNTLLGALGRVLREDWKKSTELAANIVYIFFCFSAFRQFHQIIIDYKIGGLCLTIVDFELQRTKTWLKDLDEKIKYENEAAQNKYKTKFDNAINSGDHLLRVTLYLLLNIAEDTRIQMKMRQKGINRILVECLAQPRSEEVQILAVSFLKRLSLFLENVTEMASLEVVKKLDRHLNTSHDDLMNLSLRLLLNLSFHTNLRNDMHVEVKILHRLVKLLKSEEHRISALCLLYQLSYDEKHRAVYAFVPDLIEHVIAEILKPSDGNEPEPTATALLVNLCSNVACVGQISRLHNGKVVKALVKRAFKSKSVLLMKMVRNMSQFDAAKELLLNYIGDIAQNIKKYLEKCYDKFAEADDEKVEQSNQKLNSRMNRHNLEDLEEVESFALECIGTLANLTNADIDYNLIIEEYNLWEPISVALDPTSKTPDDLILEIIILLGTCCIDDACAVSLANQGLIQMLIELLKKKQEDDELVCQIVNVINRLITHEKTRYKVVNDSQAAAYIVDLMHDSNEQIRKVCDETLDLISEVSPDYWSENIKLEKFRWHNQQWLLVLLGGVFSLEDASYDK